MEIGLIYILIVVVLKENVVVIMGSGDLNVFVIFVMVVLMENVVMSVVVDELFEGFIIVGVMMNIIYIKFLVVGDMVLVIVVLKEVEGRKFIFEVWV